VEIVEAEARREAERREGAAVDVARLELADVVEVDVAAERSVSATARLGKLTSSALPVPAAAFSASSTLEADERETTGARAEPLGSECTDILMPGPVTMSSELKRSMAQPSETSATTVKMTPKIWSGRILAHSSGMTAQSVVRPEATVEPERAMSTARLL